MSDKIKKSRELIDKPALKLRGDREIGCSQCGKLLKNINWSIMPFEVKIICRKCSGLDE